MTKSLQTYTSRAATEMALTRVKKIKKSDDNYQVLFDKYHHSFIHYRSNHTVLWVGNRELPNSFVDGMISLWQTCGKDEQIRLTSETVEEMVKDPARFIAKASKTYSQIKAHEILDVSRQTIIHWMNKGWIYYITIGDARRAIKSEVTEMLKYARPTKNMTDSTRYRPYFEKKGVWQYHVKGISKVKGVLKIAKDRIALLERQKDMVK